METTPPNSFIQLLRSDDDIFLKVEEQLRSALTRTWDERSSRAIREALEVIEGGSGELTEDDLQEVQAVLEDHLGFSFSRSVQGDLDRAVEWTYRAGQATMGVGVDFSRRDRRSMRWLKEHHEYWVRNHYDRQTKELVSKAGQEVLEKGVGRREAGKLFKQRLGAVMEGSKDYWEGLSNHVTTRSKEMSRVEGHVKAGTKKLEVLATIDKRTSCVCRYLDGMVFTIEQAVEHRDKLLEVSEPEEVKEASPWLPCDQLMGLTAEDLAAKGVVQPPYHWLCRTSLIKAG